MAGEFGSEVMNSIPSSLFCTKGKGKVLECDTFRIEQIRSENVIRKTRT